MLKSCCSAGLRLPTVSPSAVKSRRAAHTGREIVVVVPVRPVKLIKISVPKSAGVMSGVKVQPKAPAKAEAVSTDTPAEAPLPEITSPSPTTKPLKSSSSASASATVIPSLARANAASRRRWSDRQAAQVRYPNGG